jgi:hypothetical protein
MSCTQDAVGQLFRRGHEVEFIKQIRTLQWLITTSSVKNNARGGICRVDLDITGIQNIWSAFPEERYARIGHL